MAGAARRGFFASRAAIRGKGVGERKVKSEKVKGKSEEVSFLYPPRPDTSGHSPLAGGELIGKEHFYGV